MQGLFRTMSAYAGTLSSQRTEVVGMPQLTLNSAASRLVETHQNQPTVAGATPKPRAKYSSITEMHSDWYGTAGSAFPTGGISQLEKDKGTTWRASYTDQERKSLSRLKYIVRQLEQHQLELAEASASGAQSSAFLEPALTDFQEMIESISGGGSLSGLERLLKKREKEKTSPQHPNATGGEQDF
jgi:hypothetical protein